MRSIQIGNTEYCTITARRDSEGTATHFVPQDNVTSRVVYEDNYTPIAFVNGKSVRIGRDDRNRHCIFDAPIEPTYKPHITNDSVQHGVRKPNGEFSRVLTVRGTHIDTGELSTFGFITYAKHDGHKTLWRIEDGAAVPTTHKLKGAKRNSVPQVCEFLKVSRKWNVIITDR